MEILCDKKFFEQLDRAMRRSDRNGYQKCRRCGVVDGEYKLLNMDKANEHRSKVKSIVRLALIDPNGPANRAENIGYYCTRCRKPPKEWRNTRRLKPSELPQLF